MHPMPEDITTCRITRLPASRLKVPRIIELVNGPDEPPEPQIVDLPTWPGFIMHTKWPGDGPIFMFDVEVYLPGDPVDLRCSGYTASSTIAIDQTDRRLVFIVGHQRGCRAIEDMLVMAGAQS
jgi:hypothetical protein